MTSTTPTASSSTPAKSITVLYFSSAKTAVSLSSEQIPLPSSSPPSPFHLSDLPALLLKRHPEAAASGELQAVLAKSALSVNEEIEYDHEKRELKDGDVVAVLPPVSGG